MITLNELFIIALGIKNIYCIDYLCLYDRKESDCATSIVCTIITVIGDRSKKDACFGADLIEIAYFF